MQYKVVRKNEEATSAVGSDMEAFLTESELWSYDEDMAALFDDKYAEAIVSEFCLADEVQMKYDFYIKAADE